MKKTGIIIQARKGSTRLPNKMILPFYNEYGVLDIVIKKIKNKYPKQLIVLATTTNRIDDELIEIAQKNEIEYYRGDEHNVLSRFIEISDKYEVENVIRVCADNPFLDVDHISELIKNIESSDYDYVSYKTKVDIPVIKSHLGLFTEAVKSKVLKKIPNLTNNKFYFEHVTNFIYENDFRIQLLELPNYFIGTEDIRLTLDTIEDFLLEKQLYEIAKGFNTKELINYIKSDKDLMKEMTDQIKLNQK